MAGQVLVALRPLLLAVLLVLANGAGEGGTMASHRSPGLETLMEKLGFKSPVTTNPGPDSEGRDDESEDEVRAARRTMRAEKAEKERFSDEGKQLEEEYYQQKMEQDRQFPRRYAEKSSDLYKVGLVEDSGDEEEEEPSRSSKRTGNFFGKRLTRSEPRRRDEEESAQEEQQPRYGDQEEETGDREADSILPVRRAVQRKRQAPQVESDLQLESADGQHNDDNEESRSEADEALKDVPPDVADDIRLQRRHDNEMQEEESSRNAKIEEADASRTRVYDTIKDEVPHASIAEVQTGFSVGENVRAFHHGLNEWQGGKILAIHEDGKVAINWDSGSTESRSLNATEVYRPPIPGNPSPYRFEGPNAYDMLQEKENRISGHALTPSTKTKTKEIFDGFTLFPPSALGQ